jgi:dihydroorotate dehydrogenase
MIYQANPDNQLYQRSMYPLCFYLRSMYPLIRELLFLFPPEDVHYFSMNCLRMGSNISPIKKAISSQFCFNHPLLERELFGLHFKNPIGLGAGFDKNALYLRELETLGFGFVEIGTVTPKAQAGNDKPRLFRLPKDKALINRMGFNNEGLTAIKVRLEQWNENQKSEITNQKLIVGGNIGKNKITPNEDAWKDYETCFNGLHECVDYFVVNVSSPNTPGLRELQEKDALLKILSHLQTINQGKQKPKPLLLKIAPDLTKEQLDDIVSLSFETKLDGLVASNTTINRAGLQTPSSKLEEIGAGGLSGKPVRTRSTEVVQYLHEQTNGKVPIIASGGIFTGDDAKEKLDAGASLLQVWTGFVYEGPSIVKNICKQLTK